MAEFDKLSTDAVLLAAWNTLRTHQDGEKLTPFPRGFWPDVARVAVEMMKQQTLDPELDFRPTMSGDVTIHLERGRKQKLPMKEMMEVELDEDNPFHRLNKIMGG